MVIPSGTDAWYTLNGTNNICNFKKEINTRWMITKKHLKLISKQAIKGVNTPVRIFYSFQQDLSTVKQNEMIQLSL